MDVLISFGMFDLFNIVIDELYGVSSFLESCFEGFSFS